MKVFFVKPKRSLMPVFLWSVCALLGVVLVASQLFILSGNSEVFVSAKPDISGEIQDIVTISPLQPLSEGEAFIYVNAKQYAPLKDKSVNVRVYSNGVVEILSLTDKQFEVKIQHSGSGFDMISNENGTFCRRGINFLCRVVKEF